MGDSLDMIDYLKNSPVFASSLGSKELFHSNIWAYMIEQNESFLSVFFEDDYDPKTDKIKRDDNGGITGVHREKLNMDLIIETETKVFVIENKIKSLARKDQLINYPKKIRSDNKLGKKKDYYLLTGVRTTEPSVVKEVNKQVQIEGLQWEYKGYLEISKKIKKKLGSFDRESFFYKFVEEYCNVMTHIASLMLAGIKGIKNHFYFKQHLGLGLYENEDLLSGIGDIRLGDIFQKLNAERFTEKVEEIIKRDNILFGVPYEHNSGLTNSNSFAEFYFERQRDNPNNDASPKRKNKKKEIEYVRIGVQLQDAQFRWYIDVRKSGKITSIKEKVFSYGKESIGWFVAYEKKGEIVPPAGDGDRCQETSMTGLKCEYDPSFVYQYYNLNPEKDPKACYFYDLAPKVIKFLVVAKERIDDLENDFLKKAD